MDLLFSVPYIIRIIVSLMAILVFQKLTKSLAVALVFGIVLLAAWIGHSFASMVQVTSDRLFSLDTLFLVAVISGVIWLSALMSEAGIMRDLVVSLKSRLSHRAVLAALPAVVGLLPMPAGALFSAPLVDDADENKAMSPLLKTQINYWFRHVWEFWWPLYPGVLLAVDLSGLPIFTFVGLLFPLFFAAIAGGYFFLLRQVPATGNPDAGTGRQPFIPLILPTLTVIGVYGALLLVAPSISEFNKYLPMAIGVVCGLAAMQIQRPANWETWKKVLWSGRMAGLVIIVVLARIYGAFVESRLESGEYLMEMIRLELFRFGIPTLVLVVVIPFISGLTTGITVGYIGASFPVVLSLAGPSTSELFSTIVLGFGCGFIGMMLSPIHVCLIVTNEYFKTSTIKSLSGLIKPALVVIGFAALYSVFWRAVL